MLGASAKWTDQTFFYLAETRVWLLLLCCLGATPLPKKVWMHLENRLSKRKSVWYVFETLLVSGIFLLSTAFLISGSYNPFLYFRF